MSLFFATNLFVCLPDSYASPLNGMVRMKSQLTRWLGSAVLGLFATALGAAPAQAAGQNHVAGVKAAARSSAGGSAGTDVIIATSEVPRYSAQLSDGGKRLVIDIASADLTITEAESAVRAATGIVASVTTEATRDAKGAGVRVTILATEAVTYRIRSQANALTVSLAPAADNPASVAPLAFSGQVRYHLPSTRRIPQGYPCAGTRMSGTLAGCAAVPHVHARPPAVPVLVPHF